jgi:inosose dehydratase
VSKAARLRKEKKMNRFNRREFVKSIGVAAAGAAVWGGCQTNPALKPAVETAGPKPLPIPLGLASYSTRKFTLDQSIGMAKRVGMTHICLKSNHLPLDSTPEVIQQVARQVRESGLDLYAGGVIGMKSQADIDQAFNYAKQAGMRVIIVTLPYDLLPYLDNQVRQYNIKAAIHNHGPSDKTYPTPDVAYDKIKKLDPRLGVCIDIGHTLRAGMNPAKAAKYCADRLFDIHMKDIEKARPEARSTEVGRGVINIREFLHTLLDIKYAGILSFEHEKDADNPLPGLAESVGYTRGVLHYL